MADSPIPVCGTESFFALNIILICGQGRASMGAEVRNTASPLGILADAAL
jgi:hypothetical protein